MSALGDYLNELSVKKTTLILGGTCLIVVITYQYIQKILDLI
jgi:hypothetical protein